MANLGLPGPSNALEPWMTNWVVEFHFLPCRELLKAMVFSWGALPPCAGQMKHMTKDLYIFFSRSVSKLLHGLGVFQSCRKWWAIGSVANLVNKKCWTSLAPGLPLTFDAASHRLISTSGKLVWRTPRSDSRATTPANWIRFGVWSYLGPVLAWWGLPDKSPHIIPIFRFVCLQESAAKTQNVEASYGLQINQRTALYENHRLLPFRLKVPWHQAILPTFEGSNVGRRDLCGCSSPTLGLWPSCSTSILGLKNFAVLMGFDSKMTAHGCGFWGNVLCQRCEWHGAFG